MPCIRPPTPTNTRPMHSRHDTHLRVSLVCWKGTLAATKCVAHAPTAMGRHEPCTTSPASNAASAAPGGTGTLRPVAAFVHALGTLQGPVRVDKGTAPLAVSMELEEAKVMSLVLCKHSPYSWFILVLESWYFHF